VNNSIIIKNALSYALGSDLHESWRASRKLADGGYESRIKKSKDEAWNICHGTNEVDIANYSFGELILDWQFENLKAVRVVINICSC